MMGMFAKLRKRFIGGDEDGTVTEGIVEEPNVMTAHFGRIGPEEDAGITILGCHLLSMRQREVACIEAN